MKRILLSIAATLALAAAAMPTRDEQRKAAPIVAELMNPLVADFRAKKKTAAEVGDVAMTYAKEANTEAAKFLLLKGAIWYFAQAKEDAKAVAAIAALGAEVKELPPEVLRNDVLKPAIDHVSEQNVPGLFAQFRSASAQMEIAKLGPSVRRNKADEPTRRRYAELLVVTGDWKGALDVFAKLDDAKDAAKAESAGKTLAPAGDFWWSYKPTEPTAADAIKAHAVALYRKAIASGELTGLKKVVAEKRIASTPFADSFAAAETATASATVACVAGSQPKVKVIDLGGGVKMEMIYVIPGSFLMGNKREKDACPVHKVTLTKGFWLGKYEVTQEQWQQVMGTNPSGTKDDKRPVDSVSWNDCQEFIRRINTMLGGDKVRLPTEAEWEYACRAGGLDDDIDEKKKSEMGWFADNSGNESQPVGMKLANAWGFHDMYGNVWEWCNDWRDSNGGYPKEDVVDPIGPSSGSARIVRGSSFWHKLGKALFRNRWVPTQRLYTIGFRLCMNSEDPVGASARGSAVSAASGKQTTALYCVVDLAAGPNAGKYPVSYLAAEPKGGWTDEYKTKKLVLRRIEPGMFKMGGKYEVTLTKPFYCGVFEVTQKQYELVTGSNPSQYKGDLRPVEQVSWNMVRGDSSTYNWPSSANVDPNSFMGKIQARTGLNFDLPTEAQWEYACRAGTTSPYNNGGDSEADLRKLGRYLFNQRGRGWKESDADFARHEPDGKGGCWEYHTVVGSYQPNAWGLYDMHGNVLEWCLDWRLGDLLGGVTDPQGSSSGKSR
ncbi:MAG: formylglycine-generating enzyme family protein, partial [Kiritimatiellae bacterium]|nr:formylglycine-generating enzyme family protein [Kiritimatiellia bacterium]